MNTWTIISTLITGAVLGFGFLFGSIFLIIKAEDKKKAAQSQRVAPIGLIDSRRSRDTQ